MNTSPQDSSWHVVNCPTCGAVFKVPKSVDSAYAKCPQCEGSVMVEPEKPTGKIPQARTLEPVAPPVRGKETWERQAPALRVVDFKDKLGSTKDASKQIDPNAPQPVMIRRDFRKTKMTAWEGDEDAEVAPPAPPPPAQHTKVIVGLSCVVAALVGLVGWQLVSKSAVAPADSNLTKPKAVNPALPPQAALEASSAQEYGEAVWSVMTGFCSATTVEEASRFVRQPERVGALMKAYYTADRPWAPFIPNKRPDLSEFQTHRGFVVFNLEMPDFEQRAVAFEKVKDGYKFDWESFVAYSEMSWNDIRAQKPVKPVLMRVVLSRSDYNNIDFPDPAKHRAFTIRDRSGEAMLYAYVPVNTDLERKVNEEMMNAPSLHAMVRVRFLDDAKSDNQVLITDYVERGWVARAEEAAPASVLGK